VDTYTVLTSEDRNALLQQRLGLMEKELFLRRVELAEVQDVRGMSDEVQPGVERRADELTMQIDEISIRMETLKGLLKSEAIGD
jgi:hypothetical protein